MPSMLLPDPYRLRFLDSDGQVTLTADLYCAGEASAIHCVKQLWKERDIELWFGGEYIALLKHDAKLH